MKPGLRPSMPRPEYERIDAVNFSRLKFMEKSPAHYRENEIHPKAPTAAMELGSAIHCAVLEPERFAKEFVVAPKVDRRTNVGKAKWAEFELENRGKGLLTAEDADTCHGMMDGVWAHPVAQAMLSSVGTNEVAIVWEDEETGLPCKGLADRIGRYADFTWLIDVKSCRDAAEFWFAREARRLYYHAQLAFYLDGCAAIAPFERRCAWIAVENEPPYAAVVYEPAGSVLEAGRAMYRRWLRLYQSCIKADRWPGYSNKLEQLLFPEWALRNGEEW